MTNQPDIMVTIDGRAWRQAFEFAHNAGPQAAQAFSAGFMRLLERTTAIAANTIQPSNPHYAEKHGLIQIRPDRWRANNPNTSFTWGIHAVQALPHIDWAQPNLLVYAGGLIHSGIEEHEWSIHT